MANRYVYAAAAVGGDGLSLATAWQALSSVGTNMVAGDVCYVYSGTYDVRYAVPESGNSTTARMNFVGVNYLGGGLPVLRGIQCNGKDYVGIFNIKFVTPTSSYNYDCISTSAAASTGWLIQDCYFQTTYAGAISDTSSWHLNSSIIRRNTFDDIGGASAGAAGTVIMQFYGDKNLIEYNSVLKSMDRLRPVGLGLVCRNNSWGATKTSYYVSASPYPFHIDGTQGVDTNPPMSQMLYERNYDIDCVDDVVIAGSNGDNCHSDIMQFDGGHPTSWHINRFNITIRMAGADSIFAGLSSAFHYNNTCVAIGARYSPGQGNAIYFQAPACDKPLILNYSLTYSPAVTASAGGIVTVLSGTPTNTDYRNFHSYNLGAGTQPAYPVGSTGNLATHPDPLFVDGTGVAGHDDYHLQAGSPLVAAGGALTTAVGAAGGGSSTALTVVDAHRLFDGLDASGWAAADADWIKIGSGAYVQIASINYATNVITLGAARNWADADTVFLRGMEDIGGYPKTAGTSAAAAIVSGLITNTAGTATITVSDAFNVRFCELTVDGLPVATQFTPSGTVFTLTWSGDSSSTHVFMARAYSEWAAASPVAELQINIAAAAVPAKAIRSLATLGIGSAC